mgnify:FL=1|jgi:hypothetical protein
MLIKPTKYINWDEFKSIDSEAQFWTSVNDDFIRFFKQEGVIA